MHLSPPSSSSPSSSSVTIARPGKSILKRPPPPQQSFLSRLSRLLPTPATHSSDAPADAHLKRAHFYLPHLTIVYPISSANPPSGPNTREEKRTVEEREAERRRRVVRGNSIGLGSNETEEWWSLEKVESFYRECCQGRDEEVNSGISAAIRRAAGTNNQRSLDLSGIQLTSGCAATLSDIIAVEWGLRKVVFRECDLDEHVLKPMLHALLIPSSITFLSVASNRRLKAAAFRILGAYLQKTKNLQFLDVSQNVIDKKSIEHIVESLAPANEPGLVSLRLDDCSLRPAALESLAQAVRKSSLRNISLRHNRISTTGSVALAILIKDYPDTVPGGSLPSTPPPSSPALTSSLSLSPPPTPLSPASPLPPTKPLRAGPIPPPPRHPNTNVQTTYTPYVPRSRRGAASAPPTPNPLSPSGQPVPIITSSAQGGVTTRHPVPPASAGIVRDHGQSAALLGKVRALDALPRLGELRTLDLRGNDIRGGITYIAQVLKRNRTLKVLNLSENKIDVQGLVAIAEALKYNSNLETLDLSRNPCSGPALEGIQSLRTAFTLNTSLKRLFLSTTMMSSQGAIALAEFLPESTALLHLDLTVNNLELAGVMALNEGLKSNHTMRCLDLNIPPGDEEYARMCREILNTCIRNTEEAEKAGSGRGAGKGVWVMIEESELAKTFRQGDEKRTEDDIITQARACQATLNEQLSRSASSSSSPVTPRARDADPELTQRVKVLLPSLIALIQTSSDPAKMEELLALNDSLTALLAETSFRSLSNGSLTNGSPKQPASVPSSNTDDDLIARGSQPHVGAVGALKRSALGLTIDVGSHESDAEEEPEEMTPKFDKGKGRAEPEPEEPEKVLSPNFRISSSDDEEDDGKERLVGEPEEIIGAPSPNEISRSWVEEEGEVFRKGNVLLTEEAMEGEYDGEELRIELLEAQVERPPPRPLNVDDFGLDVLPPGPGPATPDLEGTSSPTLSQDAKSPIRPYLPRARSSSTQSNSPTTTQGASFSVQPASPLTPASPRPYLARRRSPSNAVETQ